MHIYTNVNRVLCTGRAKRKWSFFTKSGGLWLVIDHILFEQAWRQKFLNVIWNTKPRIMPCLWSRPTMQKNRFRIACYPTVYHSGPLSTCLFSTLHTPFWRFVCAFGCLFDIHESQSHNQSVCLLANSVRAPYGNC